MATVLALQGCVSTVMEITRTQWQRCMDLCSGQVAKAGLDWLNGERTCTCLNTSRIRYFEDKPDDDY